MTGQTLIPVDQALAEMLASAKALENIESAPLNRSLGRVLARDYTVPADVPPADNSGVDGYALAVADLVQGRPLPVSDRLPAGAAPTVLRPGTAVRIFTGSEIPPGADAVVMQERVERTGDQIVVQAEVRPGQNIRRRGQDLSEGDLALSTGTRIRPQEMGLLGSIGVSEVAVYRPLRVAVLCTGDELVEPGKPLAPGQIYNSNQFLLTGLIAQAGCELAHYETLRDNREATRASFTRAAQLADVIITSGGVSVGEEDHVRAVLETSGQLSMWRMAIKPGKPLAFGNYDGTPFIGLPGNPASVLVCFLVMAMPYLRARQGRTRTQPRGVTLPAAFETHETSVRREFVRARLEGDGSSARVAAYPNQSSGVLSSACWGDGLAVVPENTRVTPGDPVLYYSYEELLS
ncbi:MAG TPA: gephyrin-like molybdotransferase Glp [Marinobacter sp.]|jgi:molybdopterin molybdotransferase|nr:gephyrin-like molybdotransferase Glp [Marinobacter sp.]